MAPTPITEDYYMILEVEQSALPQLIVSSYRRLALKLHPDRNGKCDATEAFQRLGRAYETLKDEIKRRDYDLIYPSIIRRRTSPQNATECPPPKSTPQSEALSEAAQIAAIQKLKQERSARWQAKKKALDSSIFELKRGIRQLEREIQNLDSIVAAEAAAEAQKNSWGTWLLSPIYKKVEETVEEKARKERERQERRIEKDMKERRLELKKAELKTEETRLIKAKQEIDAADLSDDGKLRTIQAKIWARESLEKQEREKLEKERIAKLWQQQREAAEAIKKQQAERRAAEQRRQNAAQTRREQDAQFDFTRVNTHQARTTTCDHGGWWPKIQGRAECPECYDSWTYLLQCPGCKMKACPRCQAAFRPRIPRNTARTSRTVPPRRMNPSSDFGYDDFW